MNLLTDNVGSPFRCPLFIIGLNPAVDTGRDFWSEYWSDRTGFNKELLLEHLLEARGALTMTRANIEKSAALHEGGLWTQISICT